MMPVTILVGFITLGAFLFANNVLPFTNLKMKSLLYDVRQQRPEFQITEGIFYDGIDNYSIRVGKKDPVTNMLYDIRIYDHTEHRGNDRITLADSGHMQMTADRRNLIVTLWNGTSYSDIAEDSRSRARSYPSRTDVFREQRIVMEMSGFELSRSDETIFRNSYQMLNISQLSHTEDSLKKELDRKTGSYYEALVNNNFFALKSDGRSNLNIIQSSISDPDIFGTSRLRGISGASQSEVSRSQSSSGDTLEVPALKIDDFDSLLDLFQTTDRFMILDLAASNASSTMNYVLSTVKPLEYEAEYLRRHEIEWHRKFTLSFACIVFLFIGAPLGAIIRKGGLGMPTVISTLLFIIYYIISLSGEKFVRQSILTSFQGMWLSSFILAVAGVFLTYEATNDSAMLNLDTYFNWIRSRLGLQKDWILDKKAYLAGKFDFLEISKTQLQDNFRLLNELAVTCQKQLKADLSPARIMKKMMDNSGYACLIEFGIHYNGIFHEVILSKWYRVPYFQKRLSEFPNLDFKIRSRYSGKLGWIISFVLFPVGLLRFIIYTMTIRKIIKNLHTIAELSSGMVNLLDRSIMNIDIEDCK
jgi:lipopolysaccharide export system permease protein